MLKLLDRVGPFFGWTVRSLLYTVLHEAVVCGRVKVFCGRIPKEVFEDELIPLFEKCGTVWDLRLMMDPMSGYNRSFCFVTFTEKDGASAAVKQVTNYWH